MDNEWQHQTDPSEDETVEPVPVLEPISREITKETVGIFTIRVQTLMDRCSEELSVDVGALLGSLPNNHDLEEMLHKLEVYADEVKLGAPDDTPEAQEKKETNFLFHLSRLYTEYLRFSRERRQRDRG